MHITFLSSVKVFQLMAALVLTALLVFLGSWGFSIVWYVLQPVIGWSMTTYYLGMVVYVIVALYVVWRWWVEHTPYFFKE